MKSGKLTRFNLRAVTAAWASLVVLGGAGVGIDAYAADSRATSVATANVVRPIAIAQAVDGALNFGSFSVPAGGTVKIFPTATSGGGRVVVNAGPVLIGAAPGSAGKLDVTGEASLTYAITLPADGDVIIIGPGTTGIRTMAVNSFTSSPTPTGQLSALGAQTLLVGATLTTAADQVTGAYSGSYTVRVEYN